MAAACRTLLFLGFRVWGIGSFMALVFTISTVMAVLLISVAVDYCCNSARSVIPAVGSLLRVLAMRTIVYINPLFRNMPYVQVVGSCVAFSKGPELWHDISLILCATFGPRCRVYPEP